MIEYIRGTLTELSPALAVVEAHGVGYALSISLNTYSAIEGAREVLLYVHEQIVTGSRDDSYTLYGFSTKQERELYRMLLMVNGVGANTARMILSSLSPAELCRAIADGNERQLKAIKGIGPKAAQRMILELRDKIVSTGLAEAFHVSGIAPTEVSVEIDKEVRDAAVGALTMLGFSPAPSAKVVNNILQAEPTLPVEQVVKKALKQM